MDRLARGLKAADADKAIDQMLQLMGDAVDRTTLPEGLRYGEAGEKVAKQLLDVCRRRVRSFE